MRSDTPPARMRTASARRHRSRCIAPAVHARHRAAAARLQPAQSQQRGHVVLHASRCSPVGSRIPSQKVPCMQARHSPSAAGSMWPVEKAGEHLWSRAAVRRCRRRVLSPLRVDAVSGACSISPPGPQTIEQACAYRLHAGCFSRHGTQGCACSSRGAAVLLSMHNTQRSRSKQSHTSAQCTPQQHCVVPDSGRHLQDGPGAPLHARAGVGGGQRAEHGSGRTAGPQSRQAQAPPLWGCPAVLPLVR